MEEAVGNLPLDEKERESVRTLINREYNSMTGVIIRLAWQLGLTRKEMCRLQWGDFSADFLSVTVGKRTIPLERDAALFFDELHSTAITTSVVSSPRTKGPVTGQHVSLLSRRGLESVGLNHIALKDLRSDFILMQLETHSLDYVAPIANVQYFTLQQLFVPLLPAQKEPASPAKKRPEITESEIEDIIAAENGSAISIIVDLIWSAGIPLMDVATLRWKQVDLDKQTIVADGVTFDIPPRLKGHLLEIHKRRPALSDNVFLSVKTKNPISDAYITRLGRELFVKYGYYGVNFNTLQKIRRKESNLARKESTLNGMDAAIPTLEQLLNEQGYVQSSEFSQLVRTDAKTANVWLNELQRRGQLVRYGQRYYRPEDGRWIERYSERILDYISTHPNSTRPQIEAALCAPDRSAYPHLARLVGDGEIKRFGAKYTKISGEPPLQQEK